jgi:hypothetical protein
MLIVSLLFSLMCCVRILQSDKESSTPNVIHWYDATDYGISPVKSPVILPRTPPLLRQKNKWVYQLPWSCLWDDLHTYKHVLTSDLSVLSTSIAPTINNQSRPGSFSKITSDSHFNSSGFSREKNTVSASDRDKWNRILSSYIGVVDSGTYTTAWWHYTGTTRFVIYKTYSTYLCPGISACPHIYSQSLCHGPWTTQ